MESLNSAIVWTLRLVVCNRMQGTLSSAKGARLEPDLMAVLVGKVKCVGNGKERSLSAYTLITLWMNLAEADDLGSVRYPSPAETDVAYPFSWNSRHTLAIRNTLSFVAAPPTQRFQ